MSRIKPGMLATWVGPGVNWGRVVTVDRPAVSGEEFMSVDGRLSRLLPSSEPMWVISCASPLSWTTDAGAMRFFMSRPAPERYLRPILPPEEPTTTTTEETHPAFG